MKILLFFLLAPYFLFAQNVDDATTFSQLISTDTLKKHLNIFTSDAFEGRETGTEGQKKAAAYIAQQFQNMGLPPKGDNGFLQSIAFSSQSWETNELKVNDIAFKSPTDYYALPATNPSKPKIQTNRITFLGYGIDDPKYNDYKNRNVEGKVILIYSGEPMSKDSFFYISNSKKASDWSKNMTRKIEVAKQHGAAAVLIIDPKIRENAARFRSLLYGGSMTLGDAQKETATFTQNCFVSSDVVRALAGGRLQKMIDIRDKINATGKPDYLTLKEKYELNFIKNIKILTGENVIGFIEGTDEKLKNEYVFITAHYDHLGKRGETIYHGADDNASGSSSVLEIGRAFVEAKKAGKGTRRSVVVMLVSGEEKGLLGSEYYSKRPIFPLANTVVDLNVDMVGRIDPKHGENSNYIYLIGSDKLSTELHNISEANNKKYTNIELDYTYNDVNDPNRFYYRSDHYNFAKNGIPVIFYFNGTHADYHQPTDTADKINFDKMKKIASLVFYTAWEVANKETRIVVDKK
jgi:Peptidase family M28/PA domain